MFIILNKKQFFYKKKNQLDNQTKIKNEKYQ